MIIACGIDDDVWQPNHCPVGSECFQVTDSTYRICCFSGGK
uniref:Uncharacterized protein n=1 Tax=Plectus sambesii TaxID=2011161 RepID=A0A914XLT7_9BILA